MFFRITLPTLAACLCAALPSAGHADDSALYAQPAPADAAFVRFIGFEPGSRVPFEGLTFDVPDQITTSYVAVSAARLPSTQSGAYVTVLQGADGTLRRVDEPARPGRAKVHLVVVNAGTGPVTLSTADGAMHVVSGVAAGEAGSRAVNPVSVSLGVFTDGDTPLRTFDVALRRGQNLSFVVDGTDVHLIENSFGPVLN